MSIKSIIKDRDQFNNMMSDLTGLLVSEWNRRSTAEIVEIKVIPIYTHHDNGKIDLIEVDVRTTLKL